ncbi:MAG: pentapeptide repeat-containing protein [Acidobacteria bacterium]|nr:pentapeptide repeat-containing protein [Acidobacteriota bacterium]
MSEKTYRSSDEIAHNGRPLREILESHRIWLETKGSTGDKADLQRADLHGADLRLVDLRSANLRRANLSSAELSGANLNRSKSPNSQFAGSDPN